MGEFMAAVFRAVGGIWQSRDKERVFRATVISTGADVATVERIDSPGVSEGPYQCAAGLAATLSPGDQVKVQDITGDGGYVVEYLLP